MMSGGGGETSPKSPPKSPTKDITTTTPTSTTTAAPSSPPNNPNAFFDLTQDGETSVESPSAAIVTTTRPRGGHRFFGTATCKRKGSDCDGATTTIQTLRPIGGSAKTPNPTTTTSITANPILHKDPDIGAHITSLQTDTVGEGPSPAAQTNSTCSSSSSNSSPATETIKASEDATVVVVSNNSNSSSKKKSIDATEKDLSLKALVAEAEGKKPRGQNSCTHM